MSKNFGIFTAGLITGASAILALSPKVRRETVATIETAKRQALAEAALQRTAIAKSVEAVKSTYGASVKGTDSLLVVS